MDTGGNTMGGSSGSGSRPEPHLLWRRSEVGAPGVTRHTFCIQGEYSRLLQMAATLAVGCLPDGITPIPEGVSGPVASFALSRVQGATGELTITSTTQAGLDSMTGGVVFVGIDMAAVSKPIESWNGGDEGEPDLAKLAVWKEYRDKGDMESYVAYKCGDNETLTGSTLTLAMMIREQGINSYTLHYPVLTASKTMIHHDGNNVGVGLDKVFTLDQMKRFIGGERYANARADIFATLPPDKMWLMTGDRVTVNVDGTITRIEQWTGVDAVNTSLYKEYDG